MRQTGRILAGESSATIGLLSSRSIAGSVGCLLAGRFGAVVLGLSCFKKSQSVSFRSSMVARLYLLCQLGEKGNSKHDTEIPTGIKPRAMSTLLRATRAK